MKKITMFVMRGCPHCRRAFALLDELKAENETYRKLDIDVVDESAQPDLAAQYDYYYVPTFYVDGEKLHEGVPSREKVETVLRAAAG